MGDSTIAQIGTAAHDPNWVGNHGFLCRHVYFYVVESTIGNMYLYIKNFGDINDNTKVLCTYIFFSRILVRFRTK